MKKAFLSFLVLVVPCVFFCCKKSTPPPAPSSSNVISAFQFKVSSNPQILTNDIDGVFSNDTIFLTVGPSVPLTSLVPDIIMTGKTMQPENKLAQDFRNPVRYVVTAEDGKMRSYVVVVRKLSGEKQMTSFVFKAVDNSGLTADIPADSIGDTIYFHIPANADITRLVPQVTFKGVTLSPASKSPQDFSLPVSYTVTADDNSRKSYTVIANKNAFVYISCSNGVLYALDAVSGRVRWEYKAEISVGTPAFYKGIVYVVKRNYAGTELLALDFSSGNVVWQLPLPVTGNYDDIVFSDTKFVINSQFQYYVIDAVSHSIIWGGYNYDGRYASPIIRNNVLVNYFASDLLVGFNLSNGDTLWTVHTGILRGTPTEVNNLLYYSCENTQFTAVDINTGAIQFQKLPYDNGTYQRSGDTLFLSVGAIPAAFNTVTRTTIWKLNPDNSTYFNIALSGSKIITNKNGNTIVALKTTDGSRIWATDVNKYFLANSFLVANDWLYFGQSNGKVYALDAKNGAQRWSFERPGNVFSNASAAGADGKAFYFSSSGNH